MFTYIVIITVHKPEKYTYAEAAALPMSAAVAYAAVNVSYINNINNNNLYILFYDEFDIQGYP